MMDAGELAQNAKGRLASGRVDDREIATALALVSIAESLVNLTVELRALRMGHRA